jgi:excisionase family DNA binding protein
MTHSPAARRKAPSGSLPQELHCFSMRQAQHALNLSRSSLERRMKDGTLPYAKVGSVIRFRAQDILALISPSRVQGGRA